MIPFPFPIYDGVMRILHVLAQRPSLTGSGITLDTMVRRAAAAGHDQRVAVGVPADDPRPAVGGLDPEQVIPLLFGVGPLDFDVPGMSDVMPYPSTRFSELDAARLARYRTSWAEHLGAIVNDFRPDVIQSHHVWLVSALLKDVAPEIPVVTQCHATGLRQMALCPDIADEVRQRCARNDAFLVLHNGQARELAGCLDVEPHRIHVVGAGYREDIFHAHGRPTDVAPALLFVGKYSAAKGLPWLLDAYAGRASRRAGLRRHVAGGGAGAEADAIRDRIEAMAPAVIRHGQLAQRDLAELCRRSSVCVLPSFYEGLPLVLVEAFACGCRLVATDLPGIVTELAPYFGDALTVVAAPQLEAVDRPRPGEIPSFVDRLEAALATALDLPPLAASAVSKQGPLSHFTWDAVYRRVERVWSGLAR